MKNFTLKASLLAFAGMLSMTAAAQQTPAAVKKFGKPVTEAEPCGTVQYEALLREKNPNRDNKNQFEEWLAPKVAQAKAKRIQKNGNTTNEVVTIPVVFHIIHNGSPVGTAENIAEDQILSQIDVLNEDFRRMENSNGFNTSPVGADMEINFCLVKQDPNGQPSTGIVRYNLGDGDGWSMEECELVKAQTIWNPNKYLNIWVFDDIYGLAGYAQFPTNSGLEGLEGQTETANTDGVALGHIYVGSEEKYPEGVYGETRNLGRSASHEVGHFFGLRHIWGDSDSCETADDYCADTPTALEANTGCPVIDSCPDNPGNDMVENYMDYTNDSCLNIFTQNQKDRMQAVLLNSPRRVTLPTADSCTLGTASISNDGALYLIPFSTDCSNVISPVISLRNAGSNVLTSAIINYKLDNNAITSYTWTGSLAAGEDVRVELPQSGVSEGEHTFTATLQSINGVNDTYLSNNSRTNEFYYEAIQSYDTQTIFVEVQTDEAASEVIWYIADLDQNIVAFGGGYEDSPEGAYDYQEVEVDSNTCYAFIIVEQGMDGMGSGYYNITTDSGEIIQQNSGDNIFYIDYAAFGVNVELLSNATAQKTAANVTLYPNPANSIINIAAADETNMPESYTVYNSLGQVVGNGKINNTVQAIDVAAYANGVYFVKLAKGEGTTTLQFIKY